MAHYVEKSHLSATHPPRRGRLAAWITSVFAPDDMGGYTPYY